jgi:dihydroorotate dehydrogenase (fumarate)
MDLATTYLGLNLSHPFVVGASPLSGDIDMVRRLEDGGAAAIVLPSVFEEQISMAESGKIHQMNPEEPEFAAALADFPLTQPYAVDPDAYLQHLRQVKRAVQIPVIASLNGTSGHAWMKFAFVLEEEGADAIELNMDEIPLDPGRSAMAVEGDIRAALVELKRDLRIPVAVKLSPFFTALADFAHQLDEARADGLVLFNRFNHPDLDLRTLKPFPNMTLSSSAELLLRLHWVAVLRSRVRASLALSGGVQTLADGIKSILVGADIVQLVSTILRHGPQYFRVMQDGLSRWAEKRGFATLGDMRGRMSLQNTTDPSLYERANYIRVLQSWSKRT